MLLLGFLSLATNTPMVELWAFLGTTLKKGFEFIVATRATLPARFLARPPRLAASGPGFISDSYGL